MTRQGYEKYRGLTLRRLFAASEYVTRIAKRAAGSRWIIGVVRHDFGAAPTEWSRRRPSDAEHD